MALATFVSEHLYERRVLHTPYRESEENKSLANPVCVWLGDGDTLRQHLLSNKNLSRIGRSLGIERFLVMNPGLLMASDYMVATMMEAIIGAVYLDGDMQAVETLMVNLGIEAVLLDAV